MTVRYTATSVTNTQLGAFSKLLFRWRGSVYKLIWAEYLVFIVLYYLISALYRFGLNDHQRRLFEYSVKLCKLRSMEMSFVLGFFVTCVVSNWWMFYGLIPWPDPIALLVNANITGADISLKTLKKTVMRYCCLNLVLTFREVSPVVKKRYPNTDSLVQEDLLLENEKYELETMASITKHELQWLPIKWASELLTTATKNRNITSDFACQRILDELNKFRHACASLMEHESFSVPLAYIQVVTIAVYSYFAACLLGSQWLMPRAKENNIILNVHDNAKNENCRLDINGTVTLSEDTKLDIGLYFPLMDTLQFIFYMGWLKVAEGLINPFGLDDDDFELNNIIDRHIEVSYMLVGAVSVTNKDQKFYIRNGQVDQVAKLWNVPTIDANSSYGLVKVKQMVEKI